MCVAVCRAAPSCAGISLIADSKTTAPDNAVCKTPHTQYKTENVLLTLKNSRYLVLKSKDMHLADRRIGNPDLSLNVLMYPEAPR